MPFGNRSYPWTKPRPPNRWLPKPAQSFPVCPSQTTWSCSFLPPKPFPRYYTVLTILADKYTVALFAKLDDSVDAPPFLAV